jgi:hypothetical protein
MDRMTVSAGMEMRPLSVNITVVMGKTKEVLMVVASQSMNGAFMMDQRMMQKRNEVDGGIGHSQCPPLVSRRYLLINLSLSPIPNNFSL